MLRHRLVRQSAINVSSSSDSTMPSPQPIRRRPGSQDPRIPRQLSSDSLDSLLGPSETVPKRKAEGRRHSIACGVMYLDTQKPSLKSAFNFALKRMTSACSVLSTAQSTTFNLSPHQPPKKKEEKVLFPQVLGTFHQNRLPTCQGSDTIASRSGYHVNRRFSSDCPPPSYNEVTHLWNQPISRQKLSMQIVPTQSSLGSVEDDEVFLHTSNVEERLA